MAIINLPEELWIVICQFLDGQSLKSLSLVDRRLHSIIGSLAFTRLSVRPQHATRLQCMLRDTRYNKHVRTLEIYDSLEPTLHFGDGFVHPGQVNNYSADSTPIKTTHAQNASWEPVADLVRSLPALADLIWTCPQQFPPCLLQVLHADEQNLETCRLHIRTFKLRSLIANKGDRALIDPYELELIQSPNLHSIWYEHHDCVASDEIQPNHEIQQLAAWMAHGVTPNLQVVRLQQFVFTMTRATGTQSRPTRAAEHAQRLEDLLESQDRQCGRLQTFQCAGVGALSVEQVRMWSKSANFRNLRTLVLDVELEEQTLHALAVCEFPRLVALSLALYFEPGGMCPPERRPTDSASEPARAFICSLPPLKSLRLQGELIHQHLQVVLEHHGPQLQTLELVPAGYSPHRLSLRPEEVVWIGSYCQRLQQLKLRMQRSLDSADEIAAYKAIGSIPSLQTLDLELDASDYTALRNDEGIQAPNSNADPWAPVLAPARQHFDEFDRGFSGFLGEDLDPLKGHFRNMFAKAAFDLDLAEAILATLQSAKPPRRLPFVRVELQCVGGGDFGLKQIQAPIAAVIEELQHRFLFEEEWSSLDTGKYKLQELECSSSGLESIGENSRVDGRLDPRVEMIFRKLWPATGHDPDWRKDWHSFPLSER